MNKKNLRNKLIERYIENKATKEELFVFFEEAKNESFIQLIDDYHKKPKRIPVFRLISYRIVAALLIVCFLSWWGYDTYFSSNLSISSKPLSAYMPADENAILWVDGKAVKTVTDSVQYNKEISSLNEANNAIREIKIVTQAAHTFKLVLPDGSIAYLNAASEIKFPSEFRDGKRSVELSGEAYFEVKSDHQNPFYVSSHQTVAGVDRSINIKVTGTKFLVSNYADLSYARTALIEGEVSVNHKQISPSELYQLNENQIEKIVKVKNIYKYIDWVEGVFEFEGESLSHILNKIEKWYGVEFVGKEVKLNKNFGGVISRSVPLQDILQLLEENSSVRFEKLDKNRIMIL